MTSAVPIAATATAATRSRRSSLTRYNDLTQSATTAAQFIRSPSCAKSQALHPVSCCACPYAASRKLARSSNPDYPRSPGSTRTNWVPPATNLIVMQRRKPALRAQWRLCSIRLTKTLGTCDDEVDGSYGGVLSTEGALRPFENFDPLGIQRHTPQKNARAHF